LIISSNFVGCSTGRSAGLAPFRIFVHIGAEEFVRLTPPYDMSYHATIFNDSP
jgi:hypothetical protein